MLQGRKATATGLPAVLWYCSAEIVIIDSSHHKITQLAQGRGPNVRCISVGNEHAERMGAVAKPEWPKTRKVWARGWRRSANVPYILINFS